MHDINASLLSNGMSKRHFHLKFAYGGNLQFKFSFFICSVLNLHIFNNKCNSLIYLRSYTPTGIKEKFN